MREIKFRAWHKEEKIMGEVLGIDILHKEIFFSNEDADCYEHTDFKDIELMQYTGLEDKNGKEIYEGDIVKFEDCSIDGTREFYNIGVIEREGKRDELVIIHLLFEKTYFTENYMDFIDQTFEVSEIIGNIYENPELLGENK